MSSCRHATTVCSDYRTRQSLGGDEVTAGTLDTDDSTRIMWTKSLPIAPQSSQVQGHLNRDPQSVGSKSRQDKVQLRSFAIKKTWWYDDLGDQKGFCRF